MTDFDSEIANALRREVPLRVVEPAWDDVLARAASRTRSGSSTTKRRRWPLAAIGVAAVLAAIFVATPAWALVRDVLPFSDQPSAPSSVQIDFSQMGLGAPADMRPEAVSGDTRRIEQATLVGETRTLWVAPATGRFDFCWLWSDFAASCGSQTQPLGVLGMDSTEDPNTTQLIAGDVISSSVSDVVIRFSDGTSVHPQIVWVSAPINAGFFAYDVPVTMQTDTLHATFIDAYDKNGGLVAEQDLSGN